MRSKIGLGVALALVGLSYGQIGLPAQATSEARFAHEAAAPDYRLLLLGDGPTGYWRLGEAAGSTTAADQLQHAPGSLRGGVRPATPGALSGDPNTAFAFSAGASSSVYIPDAPSLHLGDTFTLEAWVRRASLNGTVEQTILSKGTGAYRLDFDTNNTFRLLQANMVVLSVANTPVADTVAWHHLVATKSGASIHMYVDGVEHTAWVATATLTDNTNPLEFGADNSNFYFDGALDEVALYPTALSSTQIQAHYAAGHPAGAPNASTVQRVNVPHLDAQIPAMAGEWPVGADGTTFSEAAALWFGKVTPTDEYSDVRLAYTNTELYVRVSAVDRQLWYDPSPASGSLTNSDAATLMLDLNGNIDEAPSNRTLRFVAQLSWWEPRARFQESYRGTGSGWAPANTPFTTETGWRGSQPNSTEDARGWVAVFRIPFASLGFSSLPPQGTVFGLGIVLHNRNGPLGTPVSMTSWPETLNPTRPTTWGQLAFGLPEYSPPSARPGGAVTIRQGLNGSVVKDGAVGGHSTCGDGLELWSDWGQSNYAGRDQFNVQSQADIADWPCFSKYYVTFPLDSIPPAKIVTSAILTLHQLGQAGGGSWGPTARSLIQIFTVDTDFDVSRLTWNTAPVPRENVARGWVDPLTEPLVYPGAARTWDVTRAVAEAYANGLPCRLALYSADGPYSTGKYFFSSSVGDWNAAGRPSLQVVWGDPAP